MKYLSVLVLFLAACACRGNSQPAVAGQVPGVEFHDIERDTTRINQLLVEVASKRLAPGDALVDLALRFKGTPYVAHTLEGDTEVLRVNLDELDCTTFVETMMAMTMSIQQNRTSWRDFVRNLQKIRYRGGEVKGYPSRLHYISEWSIDNQHRGNFKEVTDHFPRYSEVVKTIDFMSANADKYAALADSANLAGIKDMEMGLKRHKYKYIKSVDLGNKDVMAAFRNGDVVGLTLNMKNLDVGHMGVIVKKDGKPYLLHASMSGGEVIMSDVPLDEFMKRNRRFSGVRVFRLNDDN